MDIANPSLLLKVTDGDPMRLFLAAFCVTACLGCHFIASSISSTQTSPSQNDDLCPWKSPNDLLLHSAIDGVGKFRNLSVSEIKEDLSCLSRIWDRQYAATDYYTS